MIKRIKNGDTVAHTWCGMEIQSNEYYELQPLEEMIWANDAALLIDIANAIAVVNDGTTDLIDINQAINFLKDKIPNEVVTQMEKNDKTIKICSTKVDVDSDGQAVVEFKVPGSYASGDCRYVDGGRGWFSPSHAGDRVVSIKVVDKDNIFGYGASVELRSYSESEMGSDFEGWFIPESKQGLELETLGGYGVLPAGLYLVITAQKGESQTTGTFYVNVKWGKGE